MSRGENMARLMSLSDDSLDAVVAAVDWALVAGDGWLQRQVDGKLRARDSTQVVIREGARPTDRDEILRMLDAAKISHRGVEPIDDDRRARHALPDGATSLETSDERGMSGEQPFDGGYSGFFTEFVFDEHGTLIAVWGWE